MIVVISEEKSATYQYPIDIQISIEKAGYYPEDEWRIRVDIQDADNRIDTFISQTGEKDLVYGKKKEFDVALYKFLHKKMTAGMDETICLLITLYDTDKWRE